MKERKNSLETFRESFLTRINSLRISHSKDMKKMQIFNGDGKTREERETLFRAPKTEQKNKNGGVCM